MEMQDTLNEAELNEGFKDWLKSVGMNMEKTPSVIDYMMDFTSGVGMIILAALKGDKHKIKAIADMFTFEEFADFIMSLDNITMGLISTPLAIIQAITGWDIENSVKNATKNTVKIIGNIKQAIKTIRTNTAKIMCPTKQKVIDLNISDIENNLPVK